MEIILLFIIGFLIFKYIYEKLEEKEQAKIREEEKKKQIQQQKERERIEEETRLFEEKYMTEILKYEMSKIIDKITETQKFDAIKYETANKIIDEIYQKRKEKIYKIIDNSSIDEQKMLKEAIEIINNSYLKKKTEEEIENHFIEKKYQMIQHLNQVPVDNETWNSAIFGISFDMAMCKINNENMYDDNIQIIKKTIIDIPTYCKTEEEKKWFFKNIKTFFAKRK